MSYENTIKAKHSFQDSLNEFLSYLSVMSDREIEMTAAKLADSISNNDSKIDLESAKLSGIFIQLVMHLRKKGEITERKMMRVWIRVKKKEFIRKVAIIKRNPILLAYEEEKKRIKEIREKQNRSLRLEFEKWDDERSKLSFWKRLFKSLPYPTEHALTPYPVSPASIYEYEKLLQKSMKFSDLLIYITSNHNFIHLEQSTNFTNEESVKSISTKLLESK